MSVSSKGTNLHVSVEHRTVFCGSCVLDNSKLATSSGQRPRQLSSEALAQVIDVKEHLRAAPCHATARLRSGASATRAETQRSAPCLSFTVPTRTANETLVSIFKFCKAGMKRKRSVRVGHVLVAGVSRRLDERKRAVRAQRIKAGQSRAPYLDGRYVRLSLLPLRAPTCLVRRTAQTLTGGKQPRIMMNMALGTTHSPPKVDALTVVTEQMSVRRRGLLTRLTPAQSNLLRRPVPRLLERHAHRATAVADTAARSSVWAKFYASAQQRNLQAHPCAVGQGLCVHALEQGRRRRCAASVRYSTQPVGNLAQLPFQTCGFCALLMPVKGAQKVHGVHSRKILGHGHPISPLSETLR